MIKNWLLPFCILLSLTVSAQITYETTYNGWAYLVQLDVSGYKYCYLDVQSQKLKIHNLDHSLWKQVSISPPSGYVLSSSAYNVSENLFSLDNKVCFLYTCYKSSPTLQYQASIVNEDGQIMLSIADCSYAYAYRAGENETKLLAVCTNYSTNITSTKVYDLPGNLNTFSSENPLGIQLHAFPNPAGAFIYVPLPESMDGKEVHTSIRDISGKMRMESRLKCVDKVLKVSTQQLIKGVYFIVVDIESEIIYQDQFVIQ